MKKNGLALERRFFDAVAAIARTILRLDGHNIVSTQHYHTANFASLELRLLFAVAFYRPE